MNNDEKIARRFTEQGNAALQRGDVEAASELYSKSIRTCPTFAAYSNLASIRLKANDFDDAISLCTSAIAISPRSCDMHFNRGIAYAGKSDFISAIQDFSECIRLYANDYGAYLHRGWAYRNTGDWDAAIYDFTYCIQKNSNDASAYYGRAAAWYNKASWSNAIQDYSNAIRLGIEDADIYFWRANARSLNKDWDGAIQDYDMCLFFKPDMAKAHLGRALVWLDKENWQNAINDCTRAQQFGLEDAAIYGVRGSAYACIGNLDEAIHDLSESLALNPKNAVVLSNRGRAWHQKENFDAAIQDYNEAIRIQPGCDEDYFYRGLAYHDKSDLENAIRDYTECLRINPNNQNALNMLARARAGKGVLKVAAKESNNEISPTSIPQSVSNKNLPRQGLTEVISQPDLEKAERQDLKERETVEELFEQLDSLIGLDRVKKEIRQLIQFVKVQNMRQQNGLGAVDLSLHTVYFGSPGTGKTTVARIYGKMLKALGLLESGHLVETDRAGLVANYIGQTATKTDEKINAALGGVLFIDEAYSLFKSEQSAQWDYGSEAIEILMKRMEDHRNNFAVIVAGYPEPMEKFLNSNEGFKSRFVNYIHFEDYSPAELCRIFEKFCNENNFSLNNDAFAVAEKVISRAHDHKDKSFGNARYCRNIFEQIIRNQALRIGEMGNTPSIDQLRTIEANDISPMLGS